MTLSVLEMVARDYGITLKPVELTPSTRAKPMGILPGQTRQTSTGVSIELEG